jgi:hypothetical protein
MPNKIIAVDFDGCIVKDRYPEIGEPIERTIGALREERAKGATIILNTCRRDEQLEYALNWCAEQGIEFDYVNENTPQNIDLYGGDTRKINAHEYWDDKSVRMPYSDDEYNAILRTAVKTYGYRAQEDMLIEEMSELTKAILKLRRFYDSPNYDEVEKHAKLCDSIVEEIADVQIMLDQMKLIFNITPTYLSAKVERLDKRLKED